MYRSYSPPMRADVRCCDMKEQPRPAVCVHEDDALNGLPLAMAYAPWQEWLSTYDNKTALLRGTLFPCLDKPFCGRRRCV